MPKERNSEEANVGWVFPRPIICCRETLISSEDLCIRFLAGSDLLDTETRNRPLKDVLPHIFSCSRRCSEEESSWL